MYKNNISAWKSKHSGDKKRRLCKGKGVKKWKKPFFEQKVHCMVSTEQRSGAISAAASSKC